MKEIIAKGRGKTFLRSLIAAEKRVVDDQLYLIRRHGAWFRPKAHGYCGDLASAGVFTGAEARGYLAADGVGLVLARDTRDRMSSDLAELDRQAEKLRKILAEVAA
ncbi:MAG: hypothetical protein F8N15_00755 [Methanobacterium sp.]|nr:hypothetical protein [Methanobacterium sp.]